MQGKVAKAISRGNCFRRMRWNFLCAPEVQTKRHSPNAPEIQANRRAPAENAEALYTSTPSGLSPGDSPYFGLIRVRFAHPPAGFPKECLRPLLRGRLVPSPVFRLRTKRCASGRFQASGSAAGITAGLEPIACGWSIASPPNSTRRRTKALCRHPVFPHASRVLGALKKASIEAAFSVAYRVESGRTMSNPAESAR